MVGTPTTFTVSGTGVYVGTTAGTGSVIYAVSHCMPAADGAGQMLLAWRSPRAGTMPGTVTALVVDPREVDPVYVATSDGILQALSLDGALQWTFETEAPVRSTPVPDRRTGRIFFGNDAGMPYVLTMDGQEAFEIEQQHGAGSSIASTLVIVETRQRTDFGTQLVRNYYYGTESGAIYRIVTRQ
ncbi:MAG TPA: hypothetical protein ENN96_01380 [Candidatus Acetothermia bacterium]|nr:hypothetical protein [Candidatus Acetothermia bacterium]